MGFALAGVLAITPLGCDDAALVRPEVRAPADVAPHDASAVPDAPQRELVAADVLAAIDAARSAVARTPDSPGAWLELGMTLDAHGMDRPAASAYERAAALAPDDPRASYHLARVLERAGEGDRALAALRRALALAPSHAPGHARLGAWLLEAGDLDGARRAFERCRELDPRGVDAPLGLARVSLAGGHPQEAAALLEPLRAAAPELGEARFLLGRAYRALGRLDEARVELAAWDGGKASAFDPWEGEVARHTAGYQAVMDQAMGWGRAGETDRALDALEALHAASPDDSAVLEKLSGAYVAAGRLDDAERLLREALARDGGHHRTWRSLAVVAESAGDLSAALDAARECLALHPTWIHGHELLARLRWKSGDLAGAAASLEDSLRFGGLRLSPLMKLARAQSLLRRWDDARATLEQALSLAPEDAGVLVFLGEACAESGHTARAWELLDAAAARDPRQSGLGPLATRLAQLDPDAAARRPKGGG